jgi:HSP20 family protein
MTVRNFNPSTYNHLSKEFEKFFHNFSDSTSSIFGTTFPRVDIFEEEGNLFIEFEVPGLKREDLSLRIENGILTVKGEGNGSGENEKRNFIRRERKAGSFNRSFTLPEDIDAGKTEAEFNNGILTVKLQKKEEEKPVERTIDIK